MTFLNALLLGGTAAGSIPLVIHLLQRRKRKTVRWGAMQFLLLKNLSQRRRVKLEQWLLLLLRIGIPILLALCMARPVISSLAPSLNQTPLSLVLLLDDSASMGAPADDKSPSHAARATCEFLLKTLPRGSEVSVIPLSNPEIPVTQLTVDSAGAARSLSKHKNQPAPAQISAGLDAAAEVLNKAHQNRRRVILLSDFQKTNWSKEEGAARQLAGERLHAQRPAPSIALFDAGAPSTENVALESLEFSKLPVGVNQKLRFTATLRNYGSKPQPQKTLEWKVDGASISTKTASVGAHESVQLVFEHAFKEVGPHTVEARIDADSQASDDVYSASILVNEPLGVLVFNGRPSPEPMQGESDFLEIALQPRTAGGGEGAGMLRPTILDPTSGLNTKALARGKIAVLADVRTLTKQQVQELEDFVRGGGGLLVFPGRQTDVEWFNKTLHANGAGLLPARITDLQSPPAGQAQTAATIGTKFSRHPVLEPFIQAEAAFDEIRISNWYSLKFPDPEAIPSGASPSTTILSIDNGEPLFIERAYGAGTVIQSALPCSATWSNLPTRPAYLPLFQRLTLHAGIAAQPSWNLLAGQPILATLNPKTAVQPVWLKAPEGPVVEGMTRKEGAAHLAEFSNTHLPGIYQLTTADAETKQYALNVSRRESDPSRLESSEIQAVAKQLEASVSTSKEDLVSTDRTEGDGREIWRPVLWLTLLMLFAELILNRHFAVKQGAGQ